jgi:hypothetical protein
VLHQLVRPQYKTLILKDHSYFLLFTELLKACPGTLFNSAMKYNNSPFLQPLYRVKYTFRSQPKYVSDERYIIIAVNDRSPGTITRKMRLMYGLDLHNSLEE